MNSRWLKTLLLVHVFISVAVYCNAQEKSSSTELKGNNYIAHEIKEGDTLLSIADEYNIPTDRLNTVNHINGDKLVPGKVVYIPKDIIVKTPAADNNILAQVFPDEGNEDPLDQVLDTAPQDQVIEVPEEEIGDVDVVEEDLAEGLAPQDELPLEEPQEQEVSEKEEDTREENDEDVAEEAAEVVQERKIEEDEGISVVVPKETKPISQMSEDDIVNLQSEMELKDLIQTMSEISGEAFILDDSVKGKKVTIIAPQGGFKKKNALRLFETILDLNGFSVVNKDGVNKIVQKKDIKSESIPTHIGIQMGESSDRFITKLINLKNVKADELSNALKPLISKEGDILVYPTSNKLIIIDTVDNVNRILEIISNLDVEKKIEFVKIHNADAADVATKLLEIFGASGVRSTRGTTRTRTRAATRQTRTQQQTAQSAPVTGESDILGFKVITDERTNSLIIIAYPQDMEKINKVIQLLDVEADQVEQGIYVIRIRNADAEQIVSVLSSIIGSGGGSATRVTRGVERTRAGPGGLGAASAGLGAGEGRTGITRQAGAASVSTIVAESEGLRVTADPATNSVIIVGSRRDYEAIKTVIDELDIRRKQVFVEAAILEVGLNDLTAFGLNFSFGATVNGDNLIFGGQNLPGIPSLLGAAADTENTVNLVGNLSGLFLGIVGEEVDVDGSGPIPPIPSFTALFQALASVTDVNVLSTPSILTTDNEQAEIVVADVIPFPTGSTVGTSGVTVQTIERLPVGIRLAITPQISEGTFLNLNIITEVSNTTPAPPELNTEEFGIATQTRTADSSIIVRDGQTIVIGGLVSDRESILEQKTPILGDIPWVGNLFKFKQKQSQKLNLMILLTPRIVETDQDMQLILEEQQRRRMLLQERGLDVLEERQY